MPFTGMNCTLERERAGLLGGCLETRKGPVNRVTDQLFCWRTFSTHACVAPQRMPFTGMNCTQLFQELLLFETQPFQLKVVHATGCTMQSLGWMHPGAERHAAEFREKTLRGTTLSVVAHGLSAKETACWKFFICISPSYGDSANGRVS